MGRKKKGGGITDKLSSVFTKQTEAAPEGEAVAAANNRKQTSVLHETVFETVSGICRRNKLFVVKRDNEDLYVGLYLNLDDIGGLSAKSKDEAKGSMVSQINVGNITVMFNKDLEKQNGLIFVPTMDTIEHMMEYTLLRENQGYKLALIDAQGDGDFELTDVIVSLEYVHKCHTKRISIKDKLKRYLEDVDTSVDLNTYGKPQQEEPDDAGDGVPDESVPSEPEYLQDEQQEWQDDPELDSPPDFDGADMEDSMSGDIFSDDDSGYESEGDDPFGSDISSDDSDGFDSGDGSGGYDYNGEEVEVDYTLSRQTVSRRFFNDDLEVELDTASLDQALSAYVEFRPIAMRPNGTWLSDIINPLIATANDELFTAHMEILGDIQTEYLNQLEDAYLTQMGQLQSDAVKEGLAKYKAIYDDEMSKMKEYVEADQKKLQEAWDQRVKDAGEAARVTAVQAYKMKYQPAFDEQMRAIPMMAQAELDAKFAAARGEFLTDVKSQLLRALDVQNSKLVQNAVAAYKARMPDEAALLEKHKKIIQDTLDAHREEEMSRIRVLGDELKRDNRVASVIEEYNRKAEAATAEFESRIAAMQADMESQRQRFQTDLMTKSQEIADMQTARSAEQSSWNNRVNELLTQVRELQESKQREVEIRVGEMRAERDSYSEKYADLQKSQKHGHMLMIAICVIACIATLFVGMLLGSQLGGSGKDKPDPAPVTDTTEPGVGLDDISGTPDVSGTVDPNTPGGTDVVTPDGGDVTTQPGGDVVTPPEVPEDPDGITPEEWAGMQDPVIGG